MSINEAIAKTVATMPLFDHHCHGILCDDLSRTEFESLISESSWPASKGTTRFDSQVGFQVLGQCGPLLAQGREASSVDQTFLSPSQYISQRSNLGWAQVNKRLMREANITSFGVETGHTPAEITSPSGLAEFAGGNSHEIIRLERIAEDVFNDATNKDTTTNEYLQLLDEALDSRLQNAVGVKSIAAYRIGFNFSPEKPSRAELEQCISSLLKEQKPVRLKSPVLTRYLLWWAIEREQVIQLHVGYGDDDVDLHRANPLLLMEIFRASIDSGARFTLLHCYPYHREAGFLADVFPHVYFDVGLAVNYTGARSSAIIAESLELAPFGKILFSTDAFGLPELYYLGAKLFRKGLTSVLSEFADTAGWPVHECNRVAKMIGYDNAARLYSVDDR
ncbi:amidohydrolase family protein [Corynebacterium propinquum]|uniref:amidohydrolase family protein n=1 Tax=Corynebacterium propinquum TaxID=43769 RepID=UPI001EE84226|nr:amidohydrolase family protein [Corynebacterium propinquum]MCT1818011.1 amidohydrolase family protein [Corynebacterium propinquum]WKS48357.1 amidohydrolase family protein [Corynebacterium propinquum]